jgi:hypothetical protein
MSFDINSKTALLSESSIACVIPEAPRPEAIEERIDESAFVMKLPRSPKAPVVVVDPLLEVDPVGIGSPGRDILGSGRAVAIALPPEAKILESTEALDTI